MMQSRGGELKKGCIASLAKLFSVNVSTSCWIWQRGYACIANGVAVNVSDKTSRAVERKQVEIDINNFLQFLLVVGLIFAQCSVPWLSQSQYCLG